MTQKQLGELVNLTDRQLRNIDKEHADDPLLIKGESGKYDAAAFIRRWVEIKIEKASNGENDLDAVRAEHEVIKTEKTRLEVERMRGNLVDVQDIRRLWADIANTVTQSLIRLPATLAPMVQGLENIEVINGIIANEINRVLNGIAETPLPDYAAADDDAEKDEEESEA
ncbi:MAG: hypothetical protein IJ523_10505 [Succinivibrionaceae bacterium]|nr:hypothetical protein [Succinivibrionaceae bacterium]